MKADGIIIYTVGFDMDNEGAAAHDVLSYCATDASHFYLPEKGELDDAFTEIGNQINKLRISR
jgi:hypothetical protein